MELSLDLNTAERIVWGAWGLLSFILLIVYLRWVGSRAVTPPKKRDRAMPKQPK